MLRALILIFVACGSSPSEEPSADAGKVIELAGKVTATRDAVTRTLAIGNPVAADDVITTGAEASVVIELFHNNARWSLEAGITSRVDASVAWSLPKQDKALAVEHATSSAGRHADRQAADTAITAERAVQNSQNDADREAAKAKLEQLRKEQSEQQQRIAEARAAAAKAERLKGVRVSKECMENPLARGCDGPEIDASAKVAIKKMEELANEMCACKDVTCQKQVHAKYKTWRAQTDAKHPPASKIGGEIAAGIKNHLATFNACLPDAAR